MTINRCFTQAAGLLLGLLPCLSGHAQDASWICARSKSEIPAGYYVREIAQDLQACGVPRQHMLIVKVKEPAFWMCDFDNIGAPPGHVIKQQSTVSTCGCKTPVKDGNGKPYCLSNLPASQWGWPLLLVQKLGASP
jgi:hypothetical protein